MSDETREVMSVTSDKTGTRSMQPTDHYASGDADYCRLPGSTDGQGKLEGLSVRWTCFSFNLTPT